MMIKTGGKIVWGMWKGLWNGSPYMDWRTDALWIFNFTQPSFSLPTVMQEMSVRSRTNNGAFLLLAQTPCNVIKMSGWVLSVGVCEKGRKELRALPDAGENGTGWTQKVREPCQTQPLLLALLSKASV